jgi:hypothetical protein
MAQGPIATLINALKPSKVAAPVQSDANGNLIMSGISATHSALGIKIPTVVKSSPGNVVTAVVVITGSTTGSIYDTASTSGAVTANEIAVLPNTVGPVSLEFPCLQGITLVPGTGQVISLSYQ